MHTLPEVIELIEKKNIMSRIKVVFFIDSFMVGGMHRQVLYLVKHINKDVFEPIMLTSSPDGGLREEFEKTGCKLIDLKWKRTFDFMPILRLVKVLYSEKPDIIYITEAVNFVYFRIARLLWRRKILKVGSFRALTFWKGHLSKRFKYIDDFLAKWLYNSSDEVVVNSEALKNHYSNLIKINKLKPIKVIYNGSDFNFIVSKKKEEIRKKININNDDFMITMVARLDPWKDFFTLINAAKIIVEKNSKAKFVFIGKGEMNNMLKSEIKIKNMTKNIFFIGEKNNVHNYVKASDVCVLSTHGEGFSNAILEYMALSKPVIATDVGGNSEILGVDNECGFLIPKESPKIFAESIEKLMVDEPLRNSMSKSAKIRIYQLCGIENYLLSYENLFKEGLKNKK